ncbi:MAG: trimethylamine methyltransferase family protein [Gammaproteobacteria bacterium]|nr:trimethylamine methyltransferase family protein [Gammaproteobacteria bacterium]
MPPRRKKRPTAAPRHAQPRWATIRNPFPPLEPLSADQVEAVHLASMEILETIGIDFLCPEARGVMAAAGAEVKKNSATVKIDRAMVDAAADSAPEWFTLHARNPARNITVGGGVLCCGTVGSAPHCSDLDGGRRAGNHRDYRNFIRLAQHFNIIHFMSGYPVEPVDLHPSIRHLECLRDFAVLGDKVFHAYSLGRERNRDGLEIARIARAVSRDQFMQEPSLFTVVNSNSPLRLDAPMLHGIMEMAAHNQAVVLTPFTLAGAMAPVTLAGALAQQNAEALAGLVLSQAVRPGAPFVYGGFTSNVDMRSGAPAFGTPESMKAALAGGQLARRYRLPYRSSNANAANAVDAQAAYESVFSLWGAVMGRANILLHGAGWLEGGLRASFEKFILDVDLLQMVAEFLRPLPVDDGELALDAVREVGAGGHFFGAAHTQARYRNAFYQPLLSDWRNFENWRDAGAPQTVEHANRLYKKTLQEFQPPPLDPAVREELDAFVEKRKAEGGVPTDF